MAKICTLTDKEIKNAKPKEKEYSLCDGGGLFLRITPRGFKHWLFNYSSPVTRRRTNFKIGTYPDLSLQNARQMRNDYKELIEGGIDPQKHKKQQEIKDKNYFGEIAKQWFEWRKMRKNFAEKTAQKKWRLIEKHIFPNFEYIPITKITAQAVITAHGRYQENGQLETLSRLNRTMSEILTYAQHREIIINNPLLNINKEFDSPTSIHFKTISPDELPLFFKTLYNSNIRGQTRFLILWQMLTICRPSEAANAKFCDIDDENLIWNYYVLKGNKETEKGRLHKVPLTRQLVVLLNKIKAYHSSTGNPYLFPHYSKPNKQTNSQTANAAIKRMGYSGKLVAHGLRSIASTWLNEQRTADGLRKYDKDVIELALSHVSNDPVRKAYNRAEYLEQRREMLQDWADYLEQCGAMF